MQPYHHDRSARTKIHFIPVSNEREPLSIKNLNPEMAPLRGISRTHSSLAYMYAPPPIRQPSMGGDEFDFLRAPARVDKVAKGELGVGENFYCARIEI